MIQVEYVILIALFCIVATLLLRFNTRQKGAATAREIRYANARIPFFFEQRDATPEAALSAKTEYEYCLMMLRKCGNKFLDPAKDVHLFTYLADPQNGLIDFDLWRIEVHHRQRDIIESYLQEKAMLSKNAPLAARTIWAMPKTENDFNDIQKN